LLWSPYEIGQTIIFLRCGFLLSIFISPLQQQNHTLKLKYNKLTYTTHPVMQKKKKEKKKEHN